MSTEALVPPAWGQIKPASVWTALLHSSGALVVLSPRIARASVWIPEQCLPPGSVEVAGGGEGHCPGWGAHSPAGLLRRGQESTGWRTLHPGFSSLLWEHKVTLGNLLTLKSK